MLNARRLKSRAVQLPTRSTEAEHGPSAVALSNNRICHMARPEEEEQEEEEEEEEDQGNFALNSIKPTHRSGNESFVSVLDSIKACTARKDLEKGTDIHASIVRDGLLEQNAYVGSALIHMYAKCGEFKKAQQVFEALPARNVVSWNALIAGYAQQGHAEKALKYSVQMEATGLSPNVITFVCMLKACGSIGASLRGQEIHARLERENLGNNLIVTNALIDMYAKCGLLKKAQEILDKLSVSDVISWTTLITGYIQHGQSEEALKCFKQMQAKGRGIPPNAVTFLCVLKACASIGAIDKALEVHSETVKKGLLAENVVMSNTLVAVYAKCGMLDEAEQVFDNLPSQDVVSWNALIAGYVQHGHIGVALNCFDEMRSRGLFPDAVTFACILKGCTRIGEIDRGQCLHVEISRSGLLQKDTVIGIALLDMYASSGLLGRAQEVFDELPFRNVVLWTALIAGYAHHGHGEDALTCFESMQLGGFVADSVAFICLLQACGSIGAAEKGQEIHAQIVRVGMLEEDMVVGTALLDMYTNCNMLTEAQEVFDKCTVRDVVAYNVLIRNLTQHSYGEEALEYFQKMQLEGFLPDEFTLVCVLKACGSLGAACNGQEAHSSVIQLGFLDIDMVIATALVDMYASFGMLMEAQNIFDGLSDRDLVSWTVLMAGYAQLGMDLDVFHLFDRMLEESKEPSLLTFTIMLTSCSHTGSLEKGQMLFEVMSKDFGIFPTLEHYNCMVDLFSRIGCLDKALVLTSEIPFSGDLTAWHTLLGFCHIHGDSKLGKLAFEYARQLDEKDAAAYVCISNIYATFS